jgi:ABC-type sugar transport system substrate-binding protein
MVFPLPLLRQRFPQKRGWNTSNMFQKGGKNMKKLTALLLAFVMMLSLAACGGSSDTSGGDDASGGSEVTDDQSAGDDGSDDAQAEVPQDITIAFLNVTDSLAPFPQYILEDLHAICDENGWTLLDYDGQGDVNTQTDQVASVISDGEADIALLFSVDSDAGVGYVEDLTNAGIPVVTFGSDVSESGRDSVACFVGPDQDDLVAQTTSYIIDKLGKDSDAGYIVLSGWEGQYDYIAREAALENCFADCSFTLLGDVQHCGASRDTAMENATTLLNQYGDQVKFIVALSDEFALGAVQAVDACGLTGQVDIISVEAFNESLSKISDGSISATVTMTSQAVADKLAEVIPQVLSGASLDYQQNIEQNLITADNVSDFEGVLQY